MLATMLDESAAIVKNSDVASACALLHFTRLFLSTPPFPATVQLLTRGACMNPQSQACKVPPCLSPCYKTSRLTPNRESSKPSEQTRTMSVKASGQSHELVMHALDVSSVCCRQAAARFKRILEQKDSNSLAVRVAASGLMRSCFTRVQALTAACDEALSVLDVTPESHCKASPALARTRSPHHTPPPLPPLRACTRN